MQRGCKGVQGVGWGANKPAVRRLEHLPPDPFELTEIAVPTVLTAWILNKF